ncbi:dnaJ homolog subfamily C member 21-like [Bolinopsis microptera]|uniref:dnaJ homolog subfamily C member 21-like n=1 Tax=Bolinopsis microptera TaxID=2820187 RepID=UPI003079131A
MKCYYEVLGIERNSTPDQIKKGHRKLALKWHPDKNKDNEEEAHKVYQVIQEAYDCLSDPQEKAFYDKHREQILRGGSDHKDEQINVMGFYGSSCYNGFTDEPDGFYNVYNDLFVQISQEDQRYVEASDWEDPPNFGSSDTEFEDVRQFYGWWQSYCTKRNYMWLDDLYDIRQADGRRILRAMEKENKKFVDEAKKEYNESVRSLVSHIKKKDPRCLAQKEKQRVLEEERLVAEKKRKEDQRRKRAEEIERLKEQEKDSIAEHEQQLDGLLNEFSDSETEEDPFYCPLCKKLFKSDKMMKQHEKSKKHKEKLAELQGEFASELKAAGLSQPLETNDAPTPSTKKKKKKKNRRQQAWEEEEDLYDVSELKGEESVSNELSEALKDCNLNEVDLKVEEVGMESEDLLVNITSNEKTSPENIPAGANSKEDVPSEKTGGPPRPSDYAPEEEWREYMSYHYTNEETTECGVPVLTRPRGEIEESASQNIESDYTIISTAPPAQPTPAAGPKKAACNMCGADFPSKTKLFNHLQETGHSIKKEFVEKPVAKPTGNKKGKKGRRR